MGAVGSGSLHRRWFALGLVAVALLGVLVCVQPFTGDQALFASGARQLAHGDVLYRDFWDVKQPGIYAFYLAGGGLFGYSEVALHLFELVNLLAFAVLLATTLRGRFERSWIGAIVPVFVVGTYYATVEPVQLGQVESLVGIPLYVALWCSARAGAPDARRAWLLAAGVAGGVVLVFKLVLAPIVVALWFVAIVPTARRAIGHRGRLLRDGAVLVVGAALPIGAVIAYLAAHGQLETARWTYVDVTRATTGIAGRPVSRLIEGAARTVARWAVPLVLAAYGAVTTFRRGWDRFEVGLVAWAVLGVPVFLVQHWWIYQYAIFLVPIGIFAGHGLDNLCRVWGRLGRVRAVAVLAIGGVLALPLLLRVESNARDVATHGFAATAADRASLRADVEPHYRAAAAWTRHLQRVGPTPRGVYVLGNPLDLYLADRRQSVAINGWSPEQYSAEVWRRLTTQLARARPTELVVDRFSARIMRERSPATIRLIRSLYREVGGSGDDTWYHLR